MTSFATSRSSPPILEVIVSRLDTQPTPAAATGLVCERMSARYGSLTVCNGISFSIAPGELLALIGPNGAGKTSLVGALNGTVNGSGEVTLDGRRIDALPSWRRVGIGLTTVPDGRGLFPSLTVSDNLRLGALLTEKSRRDEALTGALDLFPFLKARWGDAAGALSGGQQQMLAIAKCLASSPRVLMLDEPTQGLAPIIVDELAEVLRTLCKRGLPILLVEQNHHLVETVADRFIVLVGGKVVLEGGQADLADRDRIANLYLQRSAAAIH
ncbi:MAG: ABC transporter ATP-binding protein [Rhodopseudomonas palustris]|uniref:ABC transporter ATP-binding protein n=1 Tax=Rhodopseudomonas palustris TaxID=1076 RepID=A0A933RU85_RHOPL|nr:ABC transporter ATP-binding protein [Rhodopseudomonas palustris]